MIVAAQGEAVEDQTATTYLYVDEAGRSRILGGKNERQPYFIVGVLLTNDPGALLAAVKRVRLAHHFYHEFHWTKQGDVRVAAYRDVAQELLGVPDWEYKATRFLASAVDLTLFDNQEHYSYNRFVRLAIDSALRFPKITIQNGLDITIDAKHRLSKDNLLDYIQTQYSTTIEVDDKDQAIPIIRPVAVREADSKTNDLVQMCDLFSGSHHSILTPTFCGSRKLSLANEVWLPSRCRHWEVDFAKARRKKEETPY